MAQRQFQSLERSGRFNEGTALFFLSEKFQENLVRYCERFCSSGTDLASSARIDFLRSQDWSRCAMRRPALTG